MYQEPLHTQRIHEPAALNLTSRINSAMDIVDLGLQRARRPIITTKFGPQSAVLLHLATRLKPDIPVIWVDTGFNTDATLCSARQITEMLKLDLRIYKPSHPWQDVVPALDDPLRPEFSERVKLEPFRRALEELDPDSWLTALRREQTEHREAMSPFQKTNGTILKVCPLIDWREAEMEAYLALNQLPSETDYHDPTKEAPHLECGLHNRL